MLSVNTNYGAMVALQNLTQTQADLATTQNRISTGLKVSGPADNGAVWSVAQGLRATVQAFSSVTDSLNRTISVVDTGVAAGTAVSNTLITMKQMAVSASDTSISQASRNSYNAQFTALRDSITKTLANAVFDGSNLVDGTNATIQSLANANGGSFITATGQNLSLGGAIVTVAAAGTVSTAAKASTMIATINTSFAALSLGLAQMGTDQTKLNNYRTFISKLSDALKNGIGNLVNADLAAESANLTALQTKQQLGVQALSIANQGPSILLSLFR